MLETPLTWYRKSGLIFAMVVCTATIILSGIIAFNYRHGPSVVLEGMAVGAAFGLAGLIMLGRILLRGVYRLGRDSMAQAALVYGFIVLLDVLFMVAGGISTVQGIGLNVIGLFFLIGCGFILIRTVIEQSELRTREKLLELELRLSQMTEELGKIRRGGP